MRIRYTNVYCQAGLAPVLDTGIWDLVYIITLRDYQGQGHATDLMKTVLRDADREQATLRLVPLPIGRGMDPHQLQVWYRQFGFVRTELKGHFYMVREPQGEVAVLEDCQLNSA